MKAGKGGMSFDLPYKSSRKSAFGRRGQQPGSQKCRWPQCASGAQFAKYLNMANSIPPPRPPRHDVALALQACEMVLQTRAAGGSGGGFIANELAS
jgi:hypothetical protein